MGDDLIFAQKFTRTAADGLALLAEMADPRAAHEAAVVIDMMTTVQRGAKRLRARHIYSGAQGVLSALHHDTDAVLENRIVNLGGLVTKYARGLDELLQAQDTAPATTPLDKWEMARETLNALLPTASSDDADMLSRLMRVPVTLETVQPDWAAASMDADIVPFVKAAAPIVIEEPSVDAFSLPDISPVVDDEPSPAPLTAPRIDTGPSVTLDAMMRDVIADALSVARSVERTISVSYDMGERTVSAEWADDLRGRLGQALSQIIRQSLTEDRVGHIDINLAGEQLHIMTGTTAIRVAIDPPMTKKPKPRITDDTEAGLRAQLHALMDPIALHETAS
jgi:hypothetical protein